MQPVARCFGREPSGTKWLLVDIQRAAAEAVQSLASGEVDVGAAMMKHWLKAGAFESLRL